MRKVVLFVSPLIVLMVWTMVASGVTMWGLNTMGSVLWPTWEWWGYLTATMPDENTQALVNHWLVVGAAVGTFSGAMLIYRIISDGNIRLGRDPVSLYGDARFATVADGKRRKLRYAFTPDPRCLILGMTMGFLGLAFSRRYVMLPGVEHVMLYAKTGSGKGVSYVVTNCFNYADSLVVLDLGHENEEATAAHRERTLGQKVFSFSPLANDKCSHCWNPVGGIHEGQEDYISRLQSRAYSFFPEVSGREKFWQDGARTAWLGIAVLMCETVSSPKYRNDPEMQLNPGNIFRFFMRPDVSEVLTRMIDERRQSNRPYSQTCVDLLADYISGVEEVVSGMRKHVTTTMGLWFNPRIVAATSRSDFDLAQLRREKMTIYVGVMPKDIEKLGTLLRMFFLQLFEDNTDGTPELDPTIRHRAHVLLDETTSIPPMQSIAKAVGFARKFGLHFSFVVQSKHQISEAYKDYGAASLLENLGAEIVYATDNLELMKEVSERAGNKTVDSVSRSVPRFLTFFRAKEQSETTGTIGRRLILPEDVNELPEDELYMFRASSPPFHLKRTQWFTDPHFKDLKDTWVRPPVVTFEMRRDDGSIHLGKKTAKNETETDDAQTPENDVASSGHEGCDHHHPQDSDEDHLDEDAA
jgi:type IV secretion system protein VirD4